MGLSAQRRLPPVGVIDGVLGQEAREAVDVARRRGERERVGDFARLGVGGRIARLILADVRAGARGQLAAGCLAVVDRRGDRRDSPCRKRRGEGTPPARAATGAPAPAAARPRGRRPATRPARRPPARGATCPRTAHGGGGPTSSGRGTGATRPAPGRRAARRRPRDRPRASAERRPEPRPPPRPPSRASGRRGHPGSPGGSRSRSSRPPSSSALLMLRRDGRPSCDTHGESMGVGRDRRAFQEARLRRSWPHVRAWSCHRTALAFVAWAAACAPVVSSAAYPLYPKIDAGPGPDKVALLRGPIAIVDGQGVAGKGPAFELLPGCHLVAVESDAAGKPPSVIFAFEMRPGSSTRSRPAPRSRKSAPPTARSSPCGAPLLLTSRPAGAGRRRSVTEGSRAGRANSLPARSKSD